MSQGSSQNMQGSVNTFMTKLITPGDPAVDFTLEDVQGRLVRLTDFRGKPIVMAFLRGFQ